MTTKEFTREEIVETLQSIVKEWPVDEDAEELLDLLSRRFTVEEAYSWIFFHNTKLGATPLYLLEMGHTREVFVEARNLVDS